MLNKILANWFNNTLKAPYTMIKWDLPHGCKVFPISTNQSVWYIHHINKLKNKNHMIISIGAEKTSDKIQHQFMIKSSPESGHRGNISQHNKGHIWETRSHSHTQWRRAESISSKLRKKTRISTLVTFVQHSFGSPSHSSQRGKRKKSNPNWKRSVKTFTVCRWYDIIHRKF